MRKALNRGTCQYCEGVYKIPNQLLPKHGHKKKFGFFLGNCPGSGHSPLELSCEIVPSLIARDKLRAKEVLELLRNIDNLPMTLYFADAQNSIRENRFRARSSKYLAINSVEPRIGLSNNNTHVAIDNFGVEWEIAIYANIDPAQKLREYTHKLLVREANFLISNIKTQQAKIEGWRKSDLSRL